VLAQKSEIGFWGGSATYFGDLNTNTSFRLSQPASGLFYRWNFDSRLSARASLGAGSVSGNDRFADNYYQQQRNLSFSSRIFEASVQGEFNFMDYKSAKKRYNFSPYLCGGFGIFSFDPVAIYQGNKYRLQPLGTEGQGLPEYPDRKPYKLVSREWIIGGGFKYRYSKNLSFFLEAAERRTHTDYLDDVSGQYANRIVMENETGPLVTALADRSVEVAGVPMGTTDKMRGDSHRKDNYLFISLGITVTINRYHCPFPM